MTSPPQYCGEDELADRLGIAHDDQRTSALSQACGAAARWVEQQTDRRFYTVDETRYFTPVAAYGGTSSYSGYGLGYGFSTPNRIAIDDCVSVSAVATDQEGNGTYETIWTVVTDYWIGPRNAPARGQPFTTLNRNVVTGRYFFPPYEDSVAVTGAFGATAQTPAEIRELSLYVAELFSREVMEMSIPGVSRYQVLPDLQVTMAPTDLPMVHQKTLEFWRQGSFFA